MTPERHAAPAAARGSAGGTRVCPLRLLGTPPPRGAWTTLGGEAWQRPEADPRSRFERRHSREPSPRLRPLPQPIFLCVAREFERGRPVFRWTSSHLPLVESVEASTPPFKCVIALPAGLVLEAPAGEKERPPALADGRFAHRGAGIRTRDLLLPKQARYRTAPHPVVECQQLRRLEQPRQAESDTCPAQLLVTGAALIGSVVPFDMAFLKEPSSFTH